MSSGRQWLEAGAGEVPLYTAISPTVKMSHRDKMQPDQPTGGPVLSLMGCFSVAGGERQ